MTYAPVNGLSVRRSILVTRKNGRLIYKSVVIGQKAGLRSDVAGHVDLPEKPAIVAWALLTFPLQVPIRASGERKDSLWIQTIRCDRRMVRRPGLPGNHKGFSMKDPDQHLVWYRLERIGRLIVSAMDALAQLLDALHRPH